MADMHPSMRRFYAAAALRDPSCVRQVDIANAINESSQRVNNWEDRGISKDGALAAQRLLGISATYLLDGTEPALLSQSHAVGLTGPMLASAVRMARGAVEAKGMDDFDPVEHPGDAELLALALDDVIEEGIEQAGDSDVLRFARKVNRAGAGKDEKAGPDRSDGRTDRRTGEAQARGKGAAAVGRRRKSTA